MVSVLFGKNGLSNTPACFTWLVIYSASHVIYKYVFVFMSSLLWEHIIAVAVMLLFTYILTLNLEVMITKRNNFYFEYDWFLGFVHL